MGNNHALSGVAITANKWEHLALVYSSTNTILYLDGDQIMQSGSASTGYAGSSLLQIGRSFYLGGNSYFPGKLDELAIWQTALSQTEIQTIYARQSPQYAGQLTSRVMNNAGGTAWTSFHWLTTLPFGKELPDGGGSFSESPTNYSSQTANLTSGVSGSWHLNEAQGTTGAGSVTDSSGVSPQNAGSPQGGVTFGSVGEFGSAANFNGASYISVPHSTSLDVGAPSDAFTIQFWIKTNCASCPIMSKARPSSNADMPYIISTSSGAIMFFRWNQGASVANIFTGAAIVSDQSWHHVVFETAGASSHSIYVDGAWISPIQRLGSTPIKIRMKSILEYTKTTSTPPLI